MNNKVEEFTVTIEYETLGKRYKEDYLISPDFVHSVVYTDKNMSGLDKTESMLYKMNESLREISEKI